VRSALFWGTPEERRSHQHRGGSLKSGTGKIIVLYILILGRSCVDAIFTAQQVIEKRKEHNLPLFLLFTDYEKAYDNVNRDMLWQVMEEKIPNSPLRTIKYIYKNTEVSIKFNDDTISDPIQINKGVRQGCCLSPILFNAYINKILQEFKMVINKGISCLGSIPGLHAQLFLLLQETSFQFTRSFLLNCRKFLRLGFLKVFLSI
jgi:hypothetical protein